MNWFQRLQTYHELLRYRLQAERAELRFVLGRQYQEGSILDVGAHRGEYSYWMHRQFAGDARIVAFEPQPELANHLNQFKQSFRLDRLSIERFGLSSHRGSLRMHRPR